MATDSEEMENNEYSASCFKVMVGFVKNNMYMREFSRTLPLGIKNCLLEEADIDSCFGHCGALSVCCSVFRKPEIHSQTTRIGIH